MKPGLFLSLYYAFTVAEFYHLTRKVANVRQEGRIYRANPERVYCSIISFLGPSFYAHSTYIFGNPRERHCYVADSQQENTKPFLICLLC